MENTKNNNEKMYRIALDVNERMYAKMEEIFKGNDNVSYCVEINRWDNRVVVRSYASLCYNFIVSQELRELVGSEHRSLDLDERTEDGAVERYLAEAEHVFRDYAHRAMLAKNIIDSKKA